MKKKTREHFNLLCSIVDLAELVTGSQDIENFLQRSVELVARHLNADVCSIYLYDEYSRELVLRATIGLNPLSVGRVRMHPGEGLVGTTFERLRPIREPFASCNPLFKYFEEAGEDGFESFLAVPIQRGVQRIGVLVVQHEQYDYFKQPDVMALRAAASQLAGAIENVRLLIGLNDTARQGHPADLFEDIRFIKGRTGSDGYAFAPAAVFRRNHRAVLAGSSGHCDLYTLEDYHAAVRRTAEQLMEMQNRLSERLPESAALIFTAHFMMLKDPKFNQRVVEAVENGVTPPDAVRAAARHYIQIFAASSQAYIREKANDMEDLASRILRNMVRRDPDEPAASKKGHIVIAPELYPSDILKMASDDVEGIVLVKGGITSHVSILARSLGIPVVIADHPSLLDVVEGTPVLIDGRIGNIYINPDAAVIAQFEDQQTAAQAADAVVSRRLPPETVTRDGERVRLLANINLLSELKTAREMNAEGVGLYRTEFPFIIRPTFPSEEEQYAVYRQLFEQMEGRPVTIRTLDVGGDKTLAYANFAGGDNPELGLRSIRFSLSHRSVFKQQLRAILRAGAEADGVRKYPYQPKLSHEADADGVRKYPYQLKLSHEADLRIMFPMISSLDEFIEARDLVWECLAWLRENKMDHHPSPKIGMMVEVPSVVEIIDGLAREADFFSIGTNDFVQYVLAVDRTNQKVADYYRPYHPGVLRGLARIIRAATAAGKDISICGEMGHEIAYIPFFIGAGVRSLSVAPQLLPMVQEYLSRLSLVDAGEYTEALLAEDTLKGTQAVMERYAERFRMATTSFN